MGQFIFKPSQVIFKICQHIFNINQYLFKLFKFSSQLSLVITLEISGHASLNIIIIYYVSFFPFEVYAFF